MSNIAVTLAAISQGKDLGDYSKCARCQQYDWTNIHHCKPTWLAILSDYDDEDDAHIVFADDAEQAALTFAETNYSNWDYPSNMQVWVRKDPDQPWEKFDVSIESVPSFTAEKIEGDQPQ